MSAINISVYDRFLAGLSSLLDKAGAHCAAKNIKPEAILQFRLFPDMFPFVKQVQLACDFAARGAARLAGHEPKGFPDTETSFGELKARVQAARDYIHTFPASAYEEADDRLITIKMRGNDITMKGSEFYCIYSLPQFYFHLTTAYNILRHNGIEIGKADFMAASAG